MEITIKIPDTTIKICKECGFDETKTKLVVSSFINKIMNDGYGQFNTDFDSFLNDENFEEIIGEYDNQKQKVIDRIQTIIKKWGGFTVAEVDAGSSPVITSLGNTHLLAERFEEHKVTAVLYVNDDESDEDYINYNDLSYDVLREIEHLADIWDVQNELEEDRLSN